MVQKRRPLIATRPGGTGRCAVRAREEYGRAETEMPYNLASRNVVLSVMMVSPQSPVADDPCSGHEINQYPNLGLCIKNEQREMTYVIDLEHKKIVIKRVVREIDKFRFGSEAAPGM
jgi:hypothetical protein